MIEIMKKIFYLMLACIAFTFAACSSDEVVDGGGPDVGTNGEAWLSIRVNQSSTTRAIHGSEKEEGKEDESKINKVTVVLFDGFGDNAAVTNVANFGASEIDTDKKTPGFKVSTKAKAILLIVNPTAKLPSILTGSTYADVNKSINAVVDDVIGSGKNDFMMTNASGKLEPQKAGSLSADAWVDDEDALKGYFKPTASAAVTGAMPLTVDRVVAKVRVYNEYNPVISNNPQDDSEIKLVVGTGTDFGWKLNVTNKKLFPVSLRDVTFKKSSIWSDTWNFGSYRVDPNHTTQPTVYENDGTTVTAAYTAEYNYYATDPSSWNLESSVTGGGIGDPEDPTTVKKANEEYCLENTQLAAGNYHAYTTHALVRAVIYPSHYKLFNGTYAASDKTGDWMIIDNAYYTYDTLVEWILSELTSYYDGSTPSATLTQAFNNYLTYIKTTKTIDIDGQSGPTTADKIAAIRTLLEATGATDIKTELVNHKSDSNGIVTYYSGGVNYYKIMIKHDDNTNDTDNEYGEFGVVRNSVYDIVINGFVNPGYPVIPKPDPNTPDEEEEKYLSVQIKINQWTWYTQGVIL